MYIYIYIYIHSILYIYIYIYVLNIMFCIYVLYMHLIYIMFQHTIYIYNSDFSMSFYLILGILTIEPSALTIKLI